MGNRGALPRARSRSARDLRDGILARRGPSRTGEPMFAEAVPSRVYHQRCERDGKGNPEIAGTSSANLGISSAPLALAFIQRAWLMSDYIPKQVRSADGRRDRSQQRTRPWYRGSGDDLHPRLRL